DKVSALGLHGVTNNDWGAPVIYQGNGTQHMTFSIYLPTFPDFRDGYNCTANISTGLAGFWNLENAIKFSRRKSTPSSKN
ncbi:unnamed protein product, partial [Allacma fusca]